MADFVKLAATAQRLIEANGRNVQFIRLNRVIDNATKPWRASTTVRSAPEATATVSAVLVDPVSGSKMGFASDDVELLRQLSMIALVAVKSSVEDLETFDEVLDGTTRFKIEHVEVLKPGNVKLIYIVQLSAVGPEPTAAAA